MVDQSCLHVTHRIKLLVRPMESDTSHVCDGSEDIGELHPDSISIRHSTQSYYSDVIMTAMASHFTSLMIVSLAVDSGEDQRKHPSSALLAFVRGNSPVTGEFPTQKASNAANVSIWWRNHGVHWIGRYCTVTPWFDDINAPFDAVKYYWKWYRVRQRQLLSFCKMFVKDVLNIHNG